MAELLNASDEQEISLILNQFEDHLEEIMDVDVARKILAVINDDFDLFRKLFVKGKTSRILQGEIVEIKGEKYLVVWKDADEKATLHKTEAATK